jgi:hypothetical protein
MTVVVDLGGDISPVVLMLADVHKSYRDRDAMLSHGRSTGENGEIAKVQIQEVATPRHVCHHQGQRLSYQASDRL